MRVAVTNDDGILATGILELAGGLHAAGHDVVIVAPSTEHTGTGASLGPVTNGVRTAYREMPELIPGVLALAVDGSPALCALAVAAGGFVGEVDVLISGINAGYNTGPWILHSGTIGAAMTAAIHGVPALAVSCGRPPADRNRAAAQFVASRLEELVGLSTPGTVLSINFPDAEYVDDMPSVRAPSAKVSLGGARLEVAPGEFQLWLEPQTTAADAGSDTDRLQRGAVTLTHLAAGYVDVPAYRGEATR